MGATLTRLDYCQFLLSSQINYTLTYFADHSQGFSHDAINRYLRQDQMTPRLLWDNVKDDLVPSPNGFILFDDTVLDKNYAHRIELVRRQWSGNAKMIIKGIGLVACVYVNPDLDRFWAIDYRLFVPQDDGKTKLEHVQEMLLNVVQHKALPFTTVLMDSWYATRALMMTIERLGKFYYCPLKTNRLVTESNAQPYCRVDRLSWSDLEQQQGKLVHVKDFPKGHQLKLFRLVLSTQHTDYVVTNDLTQNSGKAAQEVSVLRWKVEQFYRESKQLTGLEACQCRKARIQRNHIACAMVVWAKLKQYAHATQQTIYQVKSGLLSDYMIAQLKQPSIPISLV